MPLAFCKYTTVIRIRETLPADLTRKRQKIFLQFCHEFNF